MTIQLDSLTLPTGLYWSDEFGQAGVLQVARRRLDGGMRVYARPTTAGRPITLIAAEDMPLTRAQTSALESLAATPGAVYALTLRTLSFQVMFRHQDAPALELAPLIDYSDPSDTDWVTGTIKLITV